MCCAYIMTNGQHVAANMALLHMLDLAVATDPASMMPAC